MQHQDSTAGEIFNEELFIFVLEGQARETLKDAFSVSAIGPRRRTCKLWNESGQWSIVCISGEIYSGYLFIIPLWTYKLRILNPYRVCSIHAIPAPFDVTRCALLCRRHYRHHYRPEVGRADSFNHQFLLIFAYFCRIFA